MTKPQSIGSPEEWRRLAADSTVSMRPSAVFAHRLVETRKARNKSQAQLAARLSDVGVPLSSRALRAIEREERGLSLDEALAITLELQAVPAYMLTPPESSSPDDEVYVKLTDDYYVNGTGMRRWLRSGLRWRSSQEPPTNDAKSDAARDTFQDNLAQLAQALLDAYRGRTGVGEAVDAILTEVKRRERELVNDTVGAS